MISLAKKCFYWVLSIMQVKNPSISLWIRFIVLLISIFLFFGTCLLSLFEFLSLPPLCMQAVLFILRQFTTYPPLAYCMKRDSESEHSDGSPQKRSRTLLNELDEDTSTEPPRNITLEEVSKMPGIHFPKFPGEQVGLQTERKAEMKPYFDQSPSQAATTANLEKPESVSKAQSIQAINSQSLENNDELKLLVEKSLDTISDIASTTTKVLEAGIATTAVKKFTMSCGASKEVALACGVLAGASVLLTEDKIKEAAQGFINYQIDIIKGAIPTVDPVEKPPSPNAGETFSGDGVPFQASSHMSESLDQGATSASIHEGSKSIEPPVPSSKGEVDPKEDFIPSAFEGTYLNTDFLYSLGVQLATFLFISILVNEKKVTLCKWAKGMAKYSPSFSKFMLEFLENPFLSHGTAVRLFSCLFLIITFTLLR